MFPHPVGQKPFLVGSLFVKPPSSSSHLSGLSCFPGMLSVTHPLGVTSREQVDVMLSRSPGNFGSAGCRTTSEKGEGLSAVMGSVTLACHSTELQEEPVPVCPCQHDPLHGQCACCLLHASAASPWVPLRCTHHPFRVGPPFSD